MVVGAQYALPGVLTLKRAPHLREGCAIRIPEHRDLTIVDLVQSLLSLPYLADSE
jgi:hypothetical protein